MIQAPAGEASDPLIIANNKSAPPNGSRSLSLFKNPHHWWPISSVSRAVSAPSLSSTMQARHQPTVYLATTDAHQSHADVTTRHLHHTIFDDPTPSTPSMPSPRLGLHHPLGTLRGMFPRVLYWAQHAFQFTTPATGRVTSARPREQSSSMASIFQNIQGRTQGSSIGRKPS